MRVVQLVAQTVIGGAETYGFNLAAELARRGHRTLLMGNRANGPLLERPHPAGMDVQALHRSRRLDPRILSFLVGSIRRFRPDVLHAHNFEASAWARSLGVLFPKLVVVTHVHSGRMIVRHSPRRIRIDRVLNRRADLVIVLNTEQETYVRDRLGVPPARLRVMPNGIDTERFRPAGVESKVAHYEGSSERLIEGITGTHTGTLNDGNTDEVSEGTAEASGPLTLVSVASLTDVKNHAGLLEAFGSVAGRHPRSRLVLVGDGPLRGDLEAQVARASLTDRVTFAGLQQDVASYLERAAVFVLPSHREALPLSLLEAMATGLPSIASRVGGIPEVVEDGRHGLLVPAGDTPALAQALDRLLADAGLRQRMGWAARHLVEEHYSLGAAVDRLELEYETAIRNRRHRPGEQPA